EGRRQKVEDEKAEGRRQKVEDEKAEGRRQKVEDEKAEGRRQKAEDENPKSKIQSLKSVTLTTLRHPKEEHSDTFHVIRALGQLWLEGVSVDWDGFYKDERRSRVPLPTYPFERQRYWIDPDESLLVGLAAQGVSAVSGQQAEVKIQPDSADWLYTPNWHRVSPQSLPAQVDRQIWLIATNSTDNSDLGMQLGQQLQGLGHEVVTLVPGDQPFDQVEYRTFAVNPEMPDGYRELFDDLELRELLPNRMLYLWTPPQPSPSKSKGADPLVSPLIKGGLRGVDWVGFHGLRSLPQALTPFLKQQPIQITVITQNAHDVTGSELLNPSQASLLGLCQVIPQEYPTVGCNCIDVDSDTLSSLTLQTLAQELTQPPVDALVAYRGRHRWRHGYSAIPVDDQSKPSIALRHQGHYLIVGQMEQGLGAVIAPFLLEPLEAKLSIIQAGTISPPTEGGPRGVGIEADITDLAQMEAAIAQVEAKHGEIHGVFYSTPMSNEQSMSLLQQRDTAPWEYSLKTKIHGLDVLTKVLADRRPDFCLLQSSLSSVVGGLGLGTYSAANHVIDAIAHTQSATQSFPWISVNLDGFHQMDADNQGGRLDQQLAPFTLTAAEVWQSIQRVLALGHTAQVVVSKGDLPARLQRWIRVTPEGLVTTDTAPPGTLKKQNQHQRPQLSTAYVEPRTEMEGAIAKIWQELLGIEQVGVEDSFFELGGHSLLAIQAIARLREQFAVELPMQSLLFEAPTITGIAQLVDKQVAEMEGVSSEEEAGEDAEEMAALLAEIKALSPDEVAAELGEE
ncbi:MAG: KR domain-containing protein, partial [Cyanothece sp. SIO2G6]|nr:KR domain-containing protein [Cyanothece sp. SIO2G6]